MACYSQGGPQCGCPYCQIEAAKERMEEEDGEWACHGGPQCGCPQCDMDYAERELAREQEEDPWN